MLRALLNGEPMPEEPRYYPVPPDVELAPGPQRPGGIPLWVGSWGSRAGLARVARAGDGWLASAYNTTPERFSDARTALAQRLEERGRERGRLPERARDDVDLGIEGSSRGAIACSPTSWPRSCGGIPTSFGPQVCVGPVGHCAELLSRYAEAGCERVYLWPLGDEPRQLELIAAAVAPQLRHR